MKKEENRMDVVVKKQESQKIGFLETCLEETRNSLDNLNKTAKKLVETIEYTLSQMEESNMKSSEHEVKVTMNTVKGETVYFIPFESAEEARKYFNDEMDSDDWANIQLLENGEILDQK